MNPKPAKVQWRVCFLSYQTAQEPSHTLQKNAEETGNTSVHSVAPTFLGDNWHLFDRDFWDSLPSLFSFNITSFIHYQGSHIPSFWTRKYVAPNTLQWYNWWHENINYDQFSIQLLILTMQETVQVAFQVPIHTNHEFGEVDAGGITPIDGVHGVLSQNEWYDDMWSSLTIKCLQIVLRGT